MTYNPENSDNQNCAYQSYTRPGTAEKLSLLGLDYRVLSAQGNYMKVQTGNCTKEILDLVCGYGSCLLGHNRPELRKALAEALLNDVPFHTQLSYRHAAGRLSERLHMLSMEETGKPFVANLFNSGAEAVEAAIKHALMAYQKKVDALLSDGDKVFHHYGVLQENGQVDKIKWNQEASVILKSCEPVLLALKGGFHGKTMGALSITENMRFRKPFVGGLMKCSFIDSKNPDLEKLENYSIKVPFPETDEYGRITFVEKCWYPFVALFAEPIQGEAGALPLSCRQAEMLRNVADTYQIPLVWDEIQSGSFRAGRLLAASTFQVHGDYYLLGKALGGGIAKVSAMLVEDRLYCHEFDLLHTSTFAEDELSAITALKFLDLAVSNKQTIETEESGWQAMLNELSVKYPEVIEEVRGRGLMWCIVFRKNLMSASAVLQSIHRGGYFNYLLIAWLFHNHNIRFSAPLSNSFAIRLHPAIGCLGEERKKIYAALDSLCSILENEDNYGLMSFMLPREWQALRPVPQNFRHGLVQHEPTVQNITNCAFICHYIDDQSVKAIDPSLSCLPVEAVEYLLKKHHSISVPVILGSRMVTATTGKKAHLTVIGLPFTSDMANEALLKRSVSSYRNIIDRAVTFAENDCQAKITGLGQFTSILTRNGSVLQAKETTLTTGNAYSAWLAVEGIIAEARKAGIDPLNETLAIVGAKGNIGTMLSGILSGRIKKMRLFGNPSSSGNVANKRLLRKIRTYHQNDSLEAANNLAELSGCRLVIVATNSTTPFLEGSHLHPEAIVCDVSVPANLSHELIQNPGSRRIFNGSVATLPDIRSIPVKGLPIPKGCAFGCMAETLLLGLSGKKYLRSLGLNTIENIKELGELGKYYGFSVHVKSNIEHESVADIRN